ncbi:hypothetical protein JD969_13765 [Planctomycetota bacterium]|nr:hypothetical protein JD969_13765 [Planctomycetota bacterium]
MYEWSRLGWKISKRAVIALTVIAWSALIAPKMEAADPLTFFYEFKPLVYSSDEWFVKQDTIIASTDGQHAVGIISQLHHPRGYMNLMQDGEIVLIDTLQPTIAYAPKTNDLLQISGRHGRWIQTYKPIGRNAWVRRPMSNPIFSDDGQHIAYIGEDARHQTIVYDGKVGEPMEKIDANSIRLLSDGKGVAYCASFGPNWRLVINDKIDHDSVAIRNSLVTSKQNAQLAYLAIRDGKWHIIKTNPENNQSLVSKGYMIARQPIHISDDGSTTAVWVQDKPGTWSLAINGKVEPIYDTFNPGPITINHDGSKIVTTSKRDDNQWDLLVNGKLSLTCEAIGQNSLQFTSSNKLIAGVMWHGLWYVYLDGNLGEPATALQPNVFNEHRNGKDFVYAARDSRGQWRLIKLDLQKPKHTPWQSRPYDAIKANSVVVSSNSNTIAFVALFDGMECLIRNDQILAMRKKVSLPSLSPDGKHVAVVASKSDKFELLIDGIPTGEPFLNPIAPGIPYWDSSENTHLVVEQRPHHFSSLHVSIQPTQTDTQFGGK